MQFDGPLPTPEPYFAISNRFWKLPKNWQEIVAAVQWAAKEDMPISVTGPFYLVMNLVEQRDKRRMLVHLVNYNVHDAGAIAAIHVRCRVPRGETAKAVEVYSPDLETPASLRFATQGSTASFTVPQVLTYSVAMVSW